MPHLSLSKKDFVGSFCYDLTINHSRCQAVKPVTWSCRSDFRDGKFFVQIRRNLKVKKYEFEF